MPPREFHVSILIPVYNVEEYLAECLASVVAQSKFDDCEIVLVDDGSTDGSGAMAKQFVSEHANAVLHVQRNQGLGAARNAALRLARGRYVMFLDSDDVLPSNAVELLYNSVTTEPGIQVAVGLQRTFPSVTNWAWTGAFAKGSRVVDGIAEVPTLTHSAGACNKIFDLEALREWGMEFKEGVHFEDVWFVLPVLLRAEKIGLVNEEVYLYRRREGGGSIMDSAFTKKANYWDHLAANLHLAEVRESVDTFKHEALNLFIARSYQVYAARACRLFDEDELRGLFEGAKRLYQGIPLETILSVVTEGRYRLAVLACLMDDFELFARPEQAVRGVRARRGELFLDYPVPAHLLQFAKISSLSARMEEIRVHDAGAQVELVGRFEMNGLRLALPLSNELSVAVRGTSITLPARNVLRSDLQGPHGDGLWQGFRVTLPTAELPSGRFGLKLVWHTETGNVSRIVMLTTASLRLSRAYSLPDGGRLMPTWTKGDRFVIEVLRGRGAARRWRWRMRRRDLAHIARRGPYWKARLLRAISAPILGRRDIWLVGERRDTVQDNSWHLFRHLRQVEKRKNVYYVIAKDSPDVSRVKGLGNVVWHDSLRYTLLFLNAKKLINAYDIDAYMIPKRWSRGNYHKHLAWRTGAQRIWLQHGVVDQDVSLGAHSAKAAVDLAVTTTPAETEFVQDWMGYDEKARMLGLPRFDALVPDHGHRRILLAPTWRSYLVSPSYNSKIAAKQSFEGSTFQRFFHALLNDQRLREALERHGFVFEFLPHYEMRSIAHTMIPADGPFSVVDLSTRSFQEALRGCDVFVTDWSSTHFDVAYMQTPVVYAQFDADEFWSGQARLGYFDYARDGFGPVCETVEETVDAIVRYIENGCAREPVYDERAAATLPARDGQCCARVSKAIAELPVPVAVR